MGWLDIMWLSAMPQGPELHSPPLQNPCTILLLVAYRAGTATGVWCLLSFTLRYLNLANWLFLGPYA